MELTRNQVAERVAPRAMTRRRPNWELRGKREEAREVARFVSPRDKSAKLGDDVWGERKGKLVLQNELGSRRFFFFFTPSFQIKIVNSKGKFTWILRLKRKLEEIEREREKKRGTNFFFLPEESSILIDEWKVENWRRKRLKTFSCRSIIKIFTLPRKLFHRMNLIDESHGERERNPFPMKKCIIRAMAISGEERKEEGGEKKGKKTARAIEGIRETKKSRIGPRSSPQRERSGKKKKKKRGEEDEKRRNDQVRR